MNKELKKFLQIPRKQRGHCTSKRKRFNTPRRKIFTPEELIKHIKDNDITKCAQLKQFPQGPNQYDYRKTFGDWTTALHKAQPYLKALNNFYPQTEEEIANAIILSIIKFGLWTKEQYFNAHSLQPIIVPSYYYIQKIFRKWSIATGFARNSDLGKQFRDYVKLLKKTQNKQPTVKQMEEAGIHLPTLMKHFKAREDIYNLALLTAKQFRKNEKRLRKKTKKRKKK